MTGKRPSRGRCLACGKYAYPDRGTAKRELRRIYRTEDERRDFRAYRCPVGVGFHLGHDARWRRTHANTLRWNGGAS